MRVLFAITKGEIGGAQEHLRLLGAGLVERGHEVAVLVRTPSPLAERLAGAGAHVHDWPDIVRNPSPRHDLAARRQLRAAVRELRPDVLHLYSAKAGVLGRGLVRPPDGVTVYTCHHAPFGPGRKWSHRIIGRPVEQLTLRFVDGIVTDGARDVPMLRAIARDVPIRIVRNAVRLPAKPCSPEVPGKTALWVARMRHPKDPLQAVAAWEAVVRRHPDARLVMCGDGPLAGALRARIARSPAAYAIDYAGLVPDLTPYIATASVFVLATAVEGGITMATLESMSHGLVPVVSDAGDAFLLEHARAGAVVPRDAPGALAGAISGLFDRPEELAHMRERALAFVREWSVDDHVDAVVSFYGELLGR